MKAIMSAAILTFSAPASAAVLTNVDPVLVDTTYASVSGTTPATIDFVNTESFSVDVYWINYDGDRVFYDTLDAKSSYLQSTYITHPWLIVKAGSGDTEEEGTGILITAFASAVTSDSSGLGPDIAYIPSAVPLPASGPLLGGALAALGALGYGLKFRAGQAA